MVRAILEGRKTQTRRIVKDHEIERLSDRHEFANSGRHHLSEKEAGKKTFWTSAGVIYASDKDGRMGRVAPSRQEIKTK